MTELAEAKYSADQLKQMMSKGHAMKNEAGDPSYPIADKEDLGNAIKAVGRGSAPSDKIKSHIMARAKALNAEDMLPADWTSGSAKPGDGKKSGDSKGGKPFGKKTAVKESVDGDEEEEVLDEADQSDPIAVTELVEATRTGTGRRRKIQLMSAGWSKNGRYYGASVLAQAAKDRVFHAGLPMYVDHPTVTQKIEQPERSIKDLAARLVTDARFENGTLVAEADHFGMWQPVLNGPDGLAENVDLSVRCYGEASEGSAEGRDGLIIHRITEGKSVDYVTEGAAGGKVLELLESVGNEITDLDEGRNVGAWLESRMHCAFTEMADSMYGNGNLTREERVGLSTALGEALSSFVRNIESSQPQLYKRDLYQSPDDTVMAESQDGTSSEKKGTEMTEPQGGSAAPTPGTTRALVAQELAEARRERDLAVARERARSLIPAAMVDAWIPPSTQIRITESVMAALPVTDGRLNEVELAKMISRHVEVAEHEMTEALQAAGVGSPRELGASSQAGNFGFGVDKDATADRLNKAFSEMGLSESVAKRAANGRG